MAHDSLAAFVELAWPILEPGTPLLWNWHIDVICAHLEAVSDGHIRRLLINIPPGHMKSLIVSVFWPAWQWLHNPEWRVLACAYGMDLALRDASKTRDLIESAWYQGLFAPDWHLSHTQKAKRFYQNSRRGSRTAISVGSQTTGHRAHAVLIDDPLNAMDAYSEKKRGRAIEWLDKALSSRLGDPRTGAIVMIMQRLHHEDPSGHVLRKGGWEHLCLPTYFEPERAFRTCLADIPEFAKWGSDPRTEAGELLFPELFNQEVVKEAEGNLQELGFAGQHQQRPTPASGNIFKMEMFCRDVEREDSKIAQTKFWPFPSEKITEAYFSWDTALKDKTHNDYTAGCLTMQCVDGHVYLLPVEFRRMEVPVVEKAVALKWAEWVEKLGQALRGARIEEGAGTSLIQYINRLMVTRRDQAMPPSQDWTQGEWDVIRKAPPINVLPYNATGQGRKIERAHRVLPFISARMVRIVESPLSQAWLETLLAFPMGGPDDPVDASVAGIEPFADVRPGEPIITAEGLDEISVD